MTTPRLQHVSVPRPPGRASHDQAVAFYAGVLDLEEVPKPGTFTTIDVTWFRAGDAELHVFAQQEDEPPPAGGSHFCLVVDDLAATRARLQGAGAPCWDTDPIPHRPRFMTRDPFGNAIEITVIEGDYLDG